MTEYLCVCLCLWVALSFCLCGLGGLGGWWGGVRGRLPPALFAVLAVTRAFGLVFLNVPIDLRPHAGEDKAFITAEFRSCAGRAVFQQRPEQSPALSVIQRFHGVEVAVIGIEAL